MICCKIDSLIVEKPVELPIPDVNLRYYIDNPRDTYLHAGSGRPSPTFSRYHRILFVIHDLDSELVISRKADALSAVVR